MAFINGGSGLSVKGAFHCTWNVGASSVVGSRSEQGKCRLLLLAGECFNLENVDNLGVKQEKQNLTFSPLFLTPVLLSAGKLSASRVVV